MAADSTIQGSLTEEHKKARSPFYLEPDFAGVSFSLMHGIYYGAIIGGPLMWPAIAIAVIGFGFYLANKFNDHIQKWIEGLEEGKVKDALLTINSFLNRPGTSLFTDGLGLLAISLYAGLNVMTGGLPIEAALIPACFAIANIFKGAKMMGGNGLQDWFQKVSAPKLMTNTIGLEEFWGSAGAAFIAYFAMGPYGLFFGIPAILGLLAAGTNNGSNSKPSYSTYLKPLEGVVSRIKETNSLKDGELPKQDRELPNSETVSRRMMGYASLGYALFAFATGQPVLAAVYGAAWLANRNLEHGSRARQKASLEKQRAQTLEIT